MLTPRARDRDGPGPLHRFALGGIDSGQRFDPVGGDPVPDQGERTGRLADDDGLPEGRAGGGQLIGTAGEDGSDRVAGGD